jgi:alkyl hydroperoxide reductase subunit D
MALDHLLSHIPDYAKDLRLNLSAVLQQEELTPQQTWGAVIACSMATQNPEIIAALIPEAEAHLSAEAAEAAKSAAAVMGMNNVFYRFLHVIPSERYRTLPARLRMQRLRSHGVEQVDFELWCTAVSAMNNCQACVAAHEEKLRAHGVREETVLAAIRIAAVIHGLAAVLATEKALNRQAVCQAS